MKKTRIIIISLIIFLCVIAVAVAIIFQMTENDYKKAANKEQSTADDIELIKNNFNNIFNNDITGNYENVQKEDENKAVVYTTAEKEETIPNKYDLDVQIPKINIDNEITKKWNSEIKSTFQNKAANILSNTEKYTVYKVKYHTYINNNILSLIVKANLKEGGNPERVIIKTYNYDLEKNAEVSLNDIISNKQNKSITIDLIQDVVATYFNLRVEDLKSQRRTRNVAYPRQIAMYLSRKLTDMSLPKIGEEFGGRDHTTVIHAYEKIAKKIKEDPNCEKTITYLTDKLKQ